MVEPEEAKALGLGEIEGLEEHIRPYRNGRDLAQQSRDLMVIDLCGLEKEDVRDRFPAVYQHVKEHVKPERDQNNRKTYRDNWWILGEPQPKMRSAVSELDRYIVTPVTAKHRYFVFFSTDVLPDQGLNTFASDDAFHLGVLSSRIHVTWALAAGGRRGVGNDPRYNNTQCFDPFPFPAATEAQKEHIRRLAESLDAHRKRQLDEHPGLTMTALYNVLEKERVGEALGADERRVHEKGLVAVLREIHDELDAAVAEAYGWEPGLPEERVLEKLVALNKERRAEEEQGKVRHLRPAYQAPEEVQAELEMDVDIEVGGDGAALEPQPWPKALAERAKAVREVVTAAEEPLTVEGVASHFHRARRKQVRSLLETLEAMGLIHQVDGEFAA